MRLIVSVLISIFVGFVNANPLQIGIPPLIPPFVMANDGHTSLSGFDIDLMNEICRRIDMECQYEPLNWDKAYVALKNGTIDASIGDITITQDRQNDYLFSLPYLPSNAQFIVQDSSSIQTVNDLPGKIIGVHHIGIFGPIILKNFGSSVSIKNYHYINEMILGLTAGEVDAIIMDAAIAQNLVTNTTNLRLLPTKYRVGFGYAIVSNLGNEELIFKINQALLHMEVDGTYASIYNNYFFTAP